MCFSTDVVTIKLETIDRLLAINIYLSELAYHG